MLVFRPITTVKNYVTVQSQAPSQLRGQAQAPFVALEVRLPRDAFGVALVVELLFHAPAKARLRCRSKCEVLTEQLHHLFHFELYKKLNSIGIKVNLDDSIEEIAKKICQ